MQVSVRCFAGCKDVVGTSAFELEMPDGATVGATLELLIKTYPGLEVYRNSLMLAVNREYASLETALKQGDELACIPPVSGGGAELNV